MTEAILARVPVVAVEAEPGFAALLRRRFPQSAILQGNAFAFDDLLGSAGIADRFEAIVCGLPVIGHPAAQRRALLRMALARLMPGRALHPVLLRALAALSGGARRDGMPCRDVLAELSAHADLDACAQSLTIRPSSYYRPNCFSDADASRRAAHQMRPEFASAEVWKDLDCLTVITTLRASERARGAIPRRVPPQAA
ncbi:MAG: hypothetical protein WDM81_10540 [Rhizomicrobium sp.]